MVNCVLSGVFQVALGVTTTENMENPSVINKKKEKNLYLEFHILCPQNQKQES